jgi:ribose transport system permease protein
VEDKRMSSSATKSNVDAPDTRPFAALLSSVFRANELVLFLVVVVLLLVGFAINPRFLALDNVKIMSRDSAILAIAAIGVAFPILTGGIDLSIGSMAGLGGVLVALFIQRWGLPIWLSLALTLGIALIIGLVHGLFVTKLRMHGFLITLVTLGVARGFCLVVTNAFPITGLPAEFNAIGQGLALNFIPIPVLICAGLALIMYYLLRFSYIGRQIYAVGGNMEAARLSGIAVDRRVILCYIISAVCAALVGIIQTARLTMGHPSTGVGYELLAITGCILGGLSLMGGQGSLIGVIIGALLIGILQNELIILNINPYWHTIVISFVLLLAIAVDYLRRRKQV